MPKKCGHTEYRRVVPFRDAVQKIGVAVEARPDPNFLIVARTDARYSEGLDEALRRGEAFLRAGADVLFIESPESPDELRRIGETFRGAVLLANMVEGGRTPFLSAQELESLGYKVALFPGTGFLTAAKALRDGYAYLQRNGTSTKGPAQLPFPEMNSMMGFPAVHQFEAKWGAASPVEGGSYLPVEGGSYLPVEGGSYSSVEGGS